MSSPDEQWWEVRAGEYVLGTLDARERDLFERVMRHDPDLRRSVRGWERRLVPLVARVPEREPPPRLWTAIERRVRAERDGDLAAAGAFAGIEPREPIEAERTVTYSGVAALDEPADPGADADTGPARAAPGELGELGEERRGGVHDDDPDVTFRGAGRDGSPAEPSPTSGSAPPARSSSPEGTVPFDRARRRRGGRAVSVVAGLATAASLIMGALLYQQEQRLDALKGSILQADGVSVILGENGAPLWLVQADFEGERVQVTALAPPPTGAGGGDYQLWQVLPDGGGVSPVALLPDTDGASRVTSVPGLARRFDAFAVSLEPDGGSPEPVPTGAVLYQGGVIYPDEVAR